MEYAGAGGNDRAVANCDARRDEHIGSDPDPITERNRRGGQRHGGVGVIVAGGA